MGVVRVLAVSDQVHDGLAAGMTAGMAAGRCYRRLVADLAPAALLHGHVHPGGTEPQVRMAGRTSVCNVTGWRLLEVTPGSGLTELPGGPHHAS